MKRCFKKVNIALFCVLIVLIFLGLSASAYSEPRWNMSNLISSKHYTDSSGKTWYPAPAFYLPQFLTGVENSNGESTYYQTSWDGGSSQFKWNNHHFVNEILTPDNEPQQGYDYYYQFGAYVTNSDPKYSYVPYYSGKFYVDSKAPSVSFSPVSKQASSPITVTFGAFDSGSDVFDGDTGSGLNHYIYRTSNDNGKTWGAWSGSKTTNSIITFSDPGAYQIEVQAWDNVGNSSDWVSGSYIVGKIDAGGSVGNTSGEYRTNTDVITSVIVTNSGSDITPETGGSVTFSIPGITTQAKSFVLPAGGSEPVWFRWHTPSTPGNITATVNINAGPSSTTLTPTFNIYTLQEKTPPDPKGTDKPDAYFQYSFPPNLATTTSASWTTYAAHQEQRSGQIWNDSEKKYDTYTYQVWVFTTNSYSASLSAVLKATPDSYNPTAIQSYGLWTVKSGYGINESVTTSISSNDTGAVTGVQNVIGYYPEFMYNDTGYSFGGYNRVFEMLSGGLNSAFDLKPNVYSEHTSHVHFLPVWFRDGDYTPEVFYFDAWTPAGMLSGCATDTVHVNGSVYDDYHVYPKY
jgi:hypothetical protein